MANESGAGRLWIVAAIAVIAAATAAAFFLWRREPQQSAPVESARGAAGPRPRLLLQYLTAGENEDAVLRLNLFFVADADPAVAGEAPPPTLRITVDPSEWASRVSFSAWPEQGEPRALGAGLTLVQAPETADLDLGPGTGAVLVFRLASSARPPAGQRLRATLRLSDAAIVSNFATVPQAPDSEMMNLQQQARAVAALRQYDRVLQLGDAMVAREPQVFAGHWFRGLALEGLGRATEARQAYEAALERYPAQFGTTPDGFGDADPAVFGRVRRLRESMATTPR
jgi:tetratricopeptide (TPR) repeat protein